jgi:hypothetical protein
MGPGGWELAGLLELGLGFGWGGADEVASWVVASLRLAVPKAVTRMERPREPPTCCMTLRRLEAAPASRGGTPETATTVRGTNSRPMPRANTTMGPSRPPR